MTLFFSYFVVMPWWLPLAASAVGLVAASGVAIAAWHVARRGGEGFWRSLRASMRRTGRFLLDFTP
ncbi:MAG: hypothetical protein ACRCY8_12045 [Dermatophilaceae bacterium]